MAGDGVGGGAVGDAEAGGEGEVGDGAEGVEAVGEVGREGLAGAGDAADGDDVDEAAAAADERAGAFGGGGGGDEGDPVEPGGLGEGAELAFLLVREVDDEEAIDARLGGLLAETRGAVGEEGVVIGEEHQPEAWVTGAEASGLGEGGGEGGAGAEGDLPGGLDDGAVGDGVGEGDAQLDDVGAAFGECFEGVVAGGGVGETAGHVVDAGGAALGLGAGEDVAKAVGGKKAGERVSFRVSRLFMTDEGESYRQEIDVEVQLRADVTVENSADFSSVWRALGIRYEEAEEGGSYLLASAAYRFGFWETLGRSFVYSFKIAGSIFQILGELLTGRLGLSVLGGPVSTIAITSQVAGSSFRGFLEIAGYIGVNLAVFNLLPIPALDGSKIVFTVIEWIRGKPVNRKVEAVIHFVGLVFLLGFAVLVDILQFV